MDTQRFPKRTHKPNGSALLRFLVVSGVFGLAACNDFVAVTPFDIVPMQPRAEYRQWYDDVEDCASATGEFERIDWFSTREILHPRTGKPVAGLQRDPHTIIIADQWVNYRQVVSHEMLHDLIDDHDHRDARWDTCGLRI